MPISVSVPAIVLISITPDAGTTAENHTSPSPLPSQETTGTVELVAAVLSPETGEQLVPTVSEVAVQGSSFVALQIVRHDDAAIRF